MTTDRERAIEEALIREVIADEGKDPDYYEIVWTDEETLEDYHLRRLSPKEVELRRREGLAVAEEFLIEALREFGYSAAAREEMDVVEMERRSRQRWTRSTPIRTASRVEVSADDVPDDRAGSRPCARDVAASRLL